VSQRPVLKSNYKHSNMDDVPSTTTKKKTVCLQREGHTNGSISSACAVDQMVESVVSVAVATSTSVL
jgi:hypothetical protein